MAPLTFGLELEFIVATLPPVGTDPTPTDPRPVKNLDVIDLGSFQESTSDSLRGSVAAALKHAGLPSFADGNSPTDCPSWEVGDDNSLSAPMGREALCYTWHAVETKSPPYYFCDEGLEAIRLACTTLTKNLRINVNDSCGLHVHVGDGERGFDLPTLKNLVAFCWVFEPVLEVLHPAERRNGEYCRSIRSASRLAAQVKFPQYPHKSSQGECEACEPTLSNLEALQLIYATQSINELVRLAMHPLSPWMAMNLNPQRRPFYYIMGTKRTVEFRMHAGTMETDRVVAWIKTVVGIIELVRESDDSDFFAFLMEGVRREDEAGDCLGVIELMRSIGLDEEASYYHNRGLYT